MLNIFRYCKKESILEKKEFEYTVCKEHIKALFCLRL